MRNITCGLARVKQSIPLLLLAAITSSVYAGNSADKEAAAFSQGFNKQVWLTSGFLSHHTERNKGYNERNTGLGVEWHLSENTALSAGLYRNSVRERTHYLHYVWTPLRLGPIKIGGAVGAIDGYPELNNGNWAPALLPVARINFKVLGHDAGLNMVYIPTIAQRVDGAFAIQLKVRLF